MKFVVTGSAGNVSKPLATILLGEGHDVTVIGRKSERLAGLVHLGAKAAVGDMEDVAFLTEAFAGADGVYLMLPPLWQSEDQKAQSKQIAEGFAKAIRATDVKSVVFLSSYGAHRLDDAGAISGMGLAEIVLNGLEGVDVLHLRAGYFYTNLLLSIDLIKKQGVMGNMFEIPPGTFTMVDTGEIAQAAAKALVERDFRGHSHRYVISDESGTDEIATLIGLQIGKPDLKWVRFPKADLRQVLLEYGFVTGAADSYIEMFERLDSGLLFEDIQAVRPPLGTVKIEDFAKTFGELYHA